MKRNLSCNACMISSRQPERRPALHPVVSDHNILEDNYTYKLIANNKAIAFHKQITTSNMVKLIRP